MRRENARPSGGNDEYGPADPEREEGSVNGSDEGQERKNFASGSEAVSESRLGAETENLPGAAGEPSFGAFTREEKRAFLARGRDLFRPRTNPFGRSDATNDPDGRALALWRPAWEGSVVVAAFPLAAVDAWGGEGAWAAPLGCCIGAFGCVRLLDVVLLLRRRAKLSGKAPAFMGWATW